MRRSVMSVGKHDLLPSATCHRVSFTIAFPSHCTPLIVDVDECAVNATICPPVLPDCINTKGAFVCSCQSGFDNITSRCIGR